MSPILPCLLLFCSPAAAGVALRTPTSAADLAKQREIAELLARIAEINDERAALDDRYRQELAALPRDPAHIAASRLRAREEGAGLTEAFSALNRAKMEKAARAIELTRELYGLDPVGTFDKEGKPRGPLNVAFTTEDVPYHEWTDADGPHAESGRPDTQYYGITWADGTITVTENAFKSPGFLAATITHERVHVDHKANGTGDRMSAYERERAARDAVITDKAKAALGLTPQDVKALEDAAKDFLKHPEDFVPMPARPGLKRPSDQGYGGFGIDAEALAELDDGSSALRRSVEAETAARSQRFIGRMNESNGVVNAAFMSAAAAACNLLPVDAENGRYRAAVGHGQAVNLRYADADGFYVGLLLAHACTVPWEASPCNDGMSALARRWKDKAFRRSVVPAAGSDQEVANCFWHLVGHLRPTADFQDVRAKVAELQEEARGPSGPSNATPQKPPQEPRGGGEGRAPRPTPDRPHCRHSGAWCDGTDDPR